MEWRKNILLACRMRCSQKWLSIDSDLSYLEVKKYWIILLFISAVQLWYWWFCDQLVCWSTWTKEDERANLSLSSQIKVNSHCVAWTLYPFLKDVCYMGAHLSHRSKDMDLCPSSNPSSLGSWGWFYFCEFFIWFLKDTQNRMIHGLWQILDSIISWTSHYVYKK